MTSLEAVSTYVPAHATSVEPYLERLGVDQEKRGMYGLFFGFQETRTEPESSITDLMRSALGKLDLAGRAERVRYLVQASTILSSSYPTSPLHEVRAEFGLRNATTFSVSQHACASGLLAVDVCGKLLAADVARGGDPDALGLVLVGEKTFTEVAQVADAAVMGEGMAAVLVSHNGNSDRLISYATRGYGEFCRAPWLDAEQSARFDQLYPAALTEVITLALEKAGLTPADLSLILPHHVNRMSWLRAAKTLGIPRDRILLQNLPNYGHSFGADSFINYQTAVELGRLEPGDHYLMTAVGLGATFGAMVFQH